MSLHKIFKNIISIQNSSKGNDQEVHIVTCKDNTYVYKKPKTDVWKLDNEIKGCQLAKKLNIPAPTILKRTKTYLIQSYIPGTELSKIKPTKKILKELGVYIKRLHQIKAPYIGEKGWLTAKTEIQLYDKWMKGQVEQIGKYLPKKDIQKFFSNYKQILKNTPAVYCHSDLYPENIRVQNGKITGIIDWADLYGSYPEYDISVIYLEYFGNEYFDAFIQGYGTCNISLLKFAAASRLVWLLNENFQAKQNTALMRKRIAFLEELVTTRQPPQKHL